MYGSCTTSSCKLSAVRTWRLSTRNSRCTATICDTVNGVKPLGRCTLTLPLRHPPLDGIPGPQKLQERAVLPPPDDVARSHTLSVLLTLEATLQTLRLRVIGRSEVRGCPDAIFQASRTCAGRLAQLSSGQRFSEEERPPSERPTSATLAGQVLRTCAATSRRPPAVRKTRSSARRGCLHYRLGGLSFQRHLFNVSHMRLRSGHVLPELEIRLSS